MSFSKLFKAYKKDSTNYSQETKTTPGQVETKQILPVFSQTWHRTIDFCSDYKETHDKNITVTSNKKTLALLFMIQKDFPNELLWRLWIERLESTDYHVRIWIHAKDPSQVCSKWVKNRLVKKFQLHPGWGSLELTKTMVCLLFEAMLDCHSVDMFAFASESCMPFASISNVFQSIGPNCSGLSSNQSKSWINFRETPNNGYSRIQQFDVLKGQISDEHILKGDQWVGLTYRHARKLLQYIWYLHLHRSQGKIKQTNNIQDSSIGLPSSTTTTVVDDTAQTLTEKSDILLQFNTNNNDFLQSLTFPLILQSPIFHLFAGMKASDEMFFPTVLSMLGCRLELEKRRWTYAEWEGQASSPLSFLPAELLKKIPNLAEVSTNSSEYSLPPSRLLHPNLILAQTENTLFFRKIRWENLSYFRDLPFTSRISKHDSNQEKDEKRAEEISTLLAHAPVAQQLDLVQRWWLWIHRDELKQLQAQYIHADMNGENSNADSNTCDLISSAKRYWDDICIPIVVNVLYYNRPIDRRHRPFQDSQEKTANNMTESELGIKRGISATADDVAIAGSSNASNEQNDGATSDDTHKIRNNTEEI